MIMERNELQRIVDFAKRNNMENWDFISVVDEYLFTKATAEAYEELADSESAGSIAAPESANEEDNE